MSLRGIDLLLDMLADFGVPYLFGNPGSTELPLMDALVGREKPQYILGLQEIPVLAIAEGYAQASRMPGLINLHISCGLGNAMGMLYNAFRAGSPLVVTAGQQHQRLIFEEPILWGDMVSVASPWTKWAAEVHRVEDIPSAVRRAVQTALMPPTGPVFLSLPVDVQAAPVDAAALDRTPPRLPDQRVRPPQDAVRRAAELLAAAEHPGILVGSRIREADAVAELVAVAERLGAPVIHEATTSHGRSSFPSDHPLAGGFLAFWSPEVREQLARFDVLLVAGMKLMQQYIYHEPARPIPEHIRLIQIDDDPWELNKNYPLEVGLLGHPQPTLADLAVELGRQMTPAQTEAARLRGAACGEAHRAVREALRRQAAEQYAARPMTPLGMMDHLARILPADVAVIEESPTTAAGYFERVGAMKDTSGYFAHRGWALGWGLNCAIGVKLAWPNRPVLALIGDGSAMYGIQGLWTAARYRIPVTFVVTNNREYRILKECARVMRLPAASAGDFLAMDTVDPSVDFVALAQSLGVPARRIDDPEALASAVSQSLSANRLELIEASVRQPAAG